MTATVLDTKSVNGDTHCSRYRKCYLFVRRVWRHQRANQNPYIEEQKTHWPQEKVQKDKQRSTKHTHTTKDRVTQYIHVTSVVILNVQRIITPVIHSYIQTLFLWDKFP